MAQKPNKKKYDGVRKKTSIGNGKYTKWPNKGGGPNGSTTGKLYRKKPRGQGK